MLLEDKSVKIQNLAKLFFHEVDKKDNKIIYNLLPEAIGRMSRETGPFEKEISEKTFQTFAKNIMMYLEKEKYSENLVEKLCSRFRNSSSNNGPLSLNDSDLGAKE